ncbi:cadherin-related tumor suppressor [Anabrus simplex]|uniref:cadherin-related tumor suppressor n=1 Tax=Anabrus simplex TaxID=316456 RepID=UPI0035A34781
MYNKKSLSTKSKSHHYHTVVLTEAFYITETSSLTTNVKDIEKIEGQILRKIFGPKIQYGIWVRKSSEEMYSLTGRLNSLSRERRIQFSGHIAQMDDSRMTKKIFHIINGIRQSKKTLLRVAVLDRNDSPPSFRDAQLVHSVSEDLPPGHAVATLRASDPDTLGELRYSLVSGDDGRFELDGSTGVLRLRDSLDRETKDTYKLTVRASDGLQHTDAVVTIKFQVTDTNDNPPVFSESAYSFDVPENTGRGARVGEVSARDDDQGVNGQVTYSVVSDWANDVFSLHPQSGVFTLTARLDYEEVQHYIFVVQAQDSGRPSLSSTLTVYFNVVDLNDNAPLFDPMSYSNEAFENVTVGSPIVTVSATDLDSGDNGRIQYSISSGDDAGDFTIIQNGTIMTTRTLDRETKSLYNLVVMATDQAKPPQVRLSSTVQVTIMLKDVNDVSPEFITPNETAVAENVPANTVVMAVKAVDRDEGRNSYIEYSLSGDPMFSLGPVDGLLRVSGRLDRESRANYTLEVTARDRGDPPRATRTKILVRVLDENDNSPVFDPKQYSASVAENASIGASVLQVSATDVDEGANGRVRYAITAGDENRDFSISEDTGVVRVAKNLNFERKSRYLLTVRAEDCAAADDDMVRFDTASIAVAVADINDNPPTFLDSPYVAYVMENVLPPPAGYVITVHAHDADTPPYNGHVRYFLKEGDADLFRINASTGEVSLLRALDREAQAEYILTLVAMDTGTPPLTGSGTVRVVVQDVNDHSPEFGRQAYTTSVGENLPVGTSVLQPVATDKDAGLNAKIRYSLLGERAERFSVNADTGLVSTAISLDREDTAVYHLTLVAQDSSPTEPRAAAVNLTIHVLDDNDNAPQFSSARYTVHVPDRTQPGQFVFGAKAVDNDVGANSRILFYLSGEDAAFFTMNQETGVIKASQELRGGKDRTFQLQIQARDAGREPKIATAELAVKLWPAHLFPSITAPQETHFTLPEDVIAGRVVTRLSASSPKPGPAGSVRFAVAGGNVGDALRMDAATGEVMVAGTGLDYETAPQYVVWVEARDSDSPPLRSVLQLVINVTDANDNAPVLDSALYNATILEEEAPPEKVVRVSATDADSGSNGQVYYRLLGDEEGAFEMDADTGDIYTAVRLDRESVASYQLTVLAIDRGTPSLTGSATVIVTVLDKNDNPPRFTRLFSVNVTENAEPGAFVIKVTSSDLDVGENANATYSFTENPGDKFAIDPLTGNVTVAGPLDREAQDEYLLKVAAVDGSWRAETPLTITIQDQNDNAPEFEHSYYSFNFPELQRSVVFVGQVLAADRDKQGPNSVISYSLKHPSDLFTVDPASGEVFSKRSLRYKHTALEASPENQYMLTVMATDNGKPPMSSECLVTINVVDANNNAPSFDRPEYFSPVPESASIGQRVLRVLATDEADFGVNAEVQYLKMGGNGSDLFDLARNTGWIVVQQPLTGRLLQSFVFRVRAQDRGVPPQHADVSVTLVVTGENRHGPIFTALSYQVLVPENEPVGSTILTVSASDADEGPNGMVRYSISSGNERKEFAVDEVSGAVTIQQPLDYDTVQEYHLNITATDLGFEPRAATAMLTVTLTDINDNAPAFNQTSYEAFLQENSPPKSFVFRVHAHDIDSAKNAIVQYSLVGGTGKDSFSIEPKTGVIYSKISFDYEEKSLYSLDVVAANPDSPMYGSTKVKVHITGQNEFYPKFIQPVFHFDVSESAEVGTSVGTIQATDQDAGDDGLVYYLFVGSSNDRGFSIGPESGTIHVSRRLDRETQNRVVLTVLAKNAGGIRGNDTDEAQVIVSIQDGNDPPEFVQAVYEAQVSEGAIPGTRVATVRAVDKDVRPQNNQFSYSIISGNAGRAFKVDPQTGDIDTTARLDRETIPAYTLTVGAIDTGTPPQTGTATVRIAVLDLNDNGPVFEPPNVVGYVAENEPPGTSVMTLSATDPDLPPNGAPFTYRLVGGRQKDLVTIEPHTGVVKTTRSLDREATPRLDILVEVEDSGEPRMKSQHPVSILVLDQNDSPSTPRAVHVLVHVFGGMTPPLGKIADVHPNDVDTSGEYQCRILSSSPPHGVLTIPSSCDLHATKPTPGTGYSLSVSGNDGRHPDVVSTVSVEFIAFDNATVENSITVRIENVTASYFLAHSYKSMLDALQSAVGAGEVPMLYSMHDVDGGVEFTVAIRGPRSIYKSRSQVAEILSRKLSVPSSIASGLIVGYSPCQQRPPCANGGICTDGIRVHPQQAVITDSQTLVFSSPLVSHDFTCRCSDGFTGPRCDRRQDPCSPNPCLHGGTCRRQGFDFVCACPALREGRLCESERGAVCDGNPCLHGGSCRPSPDGYSFFCLCRPGYRGNQCEAAADSCRPNPCLHGGLCVSLRPGYRCSCPQARYGPHCERSTFGFTELSYMAFPSLDAGTNDISMVFATSKPNALLVYNYGAQTGGRSDFVALELVNGKAIFSYGGTRTAITSVTVGGESGTLADGEWHKVTATRNGRVISLSVAACTENGDVCQDCRPGDASCYADDTGPAGTLNFNNQEMFVGGLATADPILERPGQVHSDDLVGCVHSLAVNGRALNLSNPLRQRGVEPTCGRGSGRGPCAESPCGPHGVCLDHWNTATCSCGANLIAPNCNEAMDSISLSDGAALEFRVSEKHRRMQLLEAFYGGSTLWNRTASSQPPAKSLSITFRTVRNDGLLLLAASNKDFTSVELRGGQLVYVSRVGATRTPVNMTVVEGGELADGRWHNLTLHAHNRGLRLLLDGQRVGDELDLAGVHDFLDADLTLLALGGIRRDIFPNINGFEGCLANFSINNEVQPFNGSGSILSEVLQYGKVMQGCTGPVGVGTAAAPDPLSIGITLVIVFFVILFVAMLVSFVVFRLRRQKKEKGGGPGGSPGAGGGGSGGGHGKQNGGATMVAGGGLVSASGEGVLGRSLHPSEGPVGGFLGDGTDMIRGVGAHHLVTSELLSKKYKEREIVASEPRPQRPDIIEREVVGKSMPLRDEHHPPLPQSQPPPPHPSDMEVPEHYDLENASSIAPSDIDIVYHYKGYREGGNVRKYKATPPHLPPPGGPVASYHHKHAASQQSQQTQQHRHSPHHAGAFPPPHSRDSPRSVVPPPPLLQHQSTPLARLSPSSELSSQQTPRILTLQDISGKPLQSALLATTSSSGGVGKDALHSNSERSLNSPVMSQLSGHSSSASRKAPGTGVGGSEVVVGSGVVGGGSGPMGLTAEEIERLNSRPRTSSLVSTLDAVSSSSEAPRGRRLMEPGGGPSAVAALHHLNHLHHSTVNGVPMTDPHLDNHSSTSTDESGNDSFTCSEFEYDNSNGKLVEGDDDDRRGDSGGGGASGSGSGGPSSKPPLPPVPAAYDGFDSSFRGSLSTLVASDDDLSTHMGAPLYRPHNGSPASTAALGWDYLLNWGPNFESLVGVFKDIAELPDSVNNRVAASLRLPTSAPKPSEEYV